MKKHLAKQFSLFPDMKTQDKRTPAFSDTDLMPFGKHREEPMQDIPTHYLIWLWRNGLSETSKNVSEEDQKKMAIWIIEKVKVANYIWNAKDDIEQESEESL
jgi:hypothetical protein